MKNKKRKLSLLLALVLGTTPILTIANQTKTYASEKTENSFIFNEKEKKEFSKYIDFKNGKFLIKETAKKELPEVIYLKLNKVVSISNEQLINIDEKQENIEIIKPEDENKVKYSARSYVEGVTKVEYHWWGITVYLSKSTIQMISGGIGIASYWVPEPVVSKVLGSLGVAGATFIPGGIKFDYNYLAMGLNMMIPGSTIFFKGISNVRWQ